VDPGWEATRDPSARPPWLQRPGRQDLTAHVDLTAVETAMARRGLVRVACVDQTRFLIALGLKGSGARTARC
jgi:SAM-dependent MidA family methyltransferase